MRRVLVGLVFVGAIVLMGASSCSVPTTTPSSGGGSTTTSQPAGSQPTMQAPKSSTHTVRYLITVGADGQSSITYSNDQGGIEQVANFQGDWDKVYTMKSGAYAAVSAQNQRDTGSVQCTIFVDGQVWKQSSSSGAYVIADCNGLVGH